MRKFNHIFKPNKEFIERTKEVFLYSFREKFGTSQKARSFGFRYFVRGLAAGITFMVVVSSASVYADQTNVGPNNPLYSLKRTNEAVNLLLAGSEQQPGLHLKFAERRLDEVKQIKESNPSDPKILTLVKDLREEVRNSFQTIENDEDESFEEIVSSSTPKESEEENEGKEESLTELLAPSASQVILAPDSEMRGKENEDREDEDTGREDENKQRSELKIAAPVVPVNATSSEQKQEIKEKSFRKRDAALCASWNGIIQSDEEEIRKIIEERPRFLEKFGKRCL